MGIHVARSLCDCGQIKTMHRNSYLTCKHCDEGCAVPQDSCTQCASYNRSIDRRIPKL